MDVRMEIENYISTNENNGALLLTGKWGCGKTYLLKDITKEINAKNKILMVRISLFGIDSVETFHKTISGDFIQEKYLTKTKTLTVSESLNFILQ